MLKINKRKAKRLFEEGSDVYLKPCKSGHFISEILIPRDVDFEEFVDRMTFHLCSVTEGYYLHFFTTT